MSKTYKIGELETVALADVSFEIKKGEFVAIMGPSGSGKSTLMHILGALDKPSSGKYFLDGENMAGLSDDELAEVRNKKIGFIFQAYNLLPRTTALKNVMLPMVYADITADERRRRAEMYLEMVGLKDRFFHTSNQLSGGQQQRVAIARGLVMNPSILESRVEKLTGLLEVGKAMASERNLDRLLQLILGEVTKVMAADRSSLFLVDRERNELWSKIAQGLEVREIRVKIGLGIAGYVAQTGKIVNIQDAYADPRFNQETDLRTGYRTRTILCVPMQNHLSEVIGVLQVLNKRDDVFTREDEELLLALSSQAAVAIENAILYEDIQKLFEGFIKASVYAIESRDPTTSGHSERVAILTIGLAEKVDRADGGPFASITFSPEDMRELRYASLLHDFGKVGVREPVLVKANKLYEHHLDLIVARFNFIKKALENSYLQKKLSLALTLGPSCQEGLASLDEELQRRVAEVDDQMNFILEANKPTVLPQGGFERILDIAAKTFVDGDGGKIPYLSTKEAENLTIGKGSLNVEERLEIESHVTHSFRFLRQIPWTKDLRRVPTIAYAHHEKLNGTGYPNQLRSEDIPFQAKIMTVCDIYDALTASDRPYKRALPPERAIDILGLEVKDGNLDPELVRIFTDAKVWTLTVGMRPGA